MDIRSRRWQVTRLACLDRDGWRCRMLVDEDGMPLADQTDRTAGRECGETLTRDNPRAPTHGTADHIVPRTVGGSDLLSNLQAASLRCNSRRSAVIVNAVRRGPLNLSRAWW